MGYNITKRISVLRKQVEEDRVGQWGLFRTTVLSVILLGGIATFVIPSGDDSIQPTEERKDTWLEEQEKQFLSRKQWLKDSPFVLSPGASQLYTSFSKAVVSNLPNRAAAPLPEEEQPIIDIDGIQVWIGRAITSGLMRGGFVIIAFWPLWLLGSLFGYYSIRRTIKRTRSESVLGVCDRGEGPYYSGIYGAFRPNSSASATDYSCPGLACPKQETKNKALAHRLTQLLKKFGAFNETNIGLIQVIIAHKDFPSYVEEEGLVADDAEQNESAEAEDKVSQTGYYTNENGRVEATALAGLLAVLEAHQRISRYVSSLEKRGAKNSALNKNYAGHLANLEKLTNSISPLTKLLITSLTPNRLWAMGHLSPSLVSSAYLATEAGKCLVFRQHGEGYVKTSVYPHLQARAVIHSLPTYHREYSGDLRMIIRQAIICSRRHGDFGRAFLPNRMSVESRVLRDWLEILGSSEEKQDETAQLVELDAHMEEISINWRLGFSGRLKREQEQKLSDPTKVVDSDLWKGLVYKSVVLMPLKEVITTALKGIPKRRSERITELLSLTRKHQTRLSISARLPGFKRQALEADTGDQENSGILQSLSTDEEGKNLIDRWRIVRRMLTRYNWLSTRVGDDAVPIAGLVQATVNKGQETTKEETISLEALAPLRQRRFIELFGKSWEGEFYADSAHPEEIRVFINNQEFRDALKTGNGKPEASEDDSSSGNQSSSIASG